MEPEYMTVAEAQAELGLTKRKIADLIKHGDLPSEPNPFDRRSRLIPRKSVEALKAKMPKKFAA